MKKLTDIIRSTFATEDDITPLAVTEIEYLTAVLQEGGRTYPPVPSGVLHQSPPHSSRLQTSQCPNR